DEQAQVGQRAVEGQVEELVVRLDRGRASAPRVIGARAVVARDPGRLGEERRGSLVGGLLLALRGDRRPEGPTELVAVTRLQAHVPAEADAAAAQDLIVGPAV